MTARRARLVLAGVVLIALAAWLGGGLARSPAEPRDAASNAIAARADDGDAEPRVIPAPTPARPLTSGADVADATGDGAGDAAGTAAPASRPIEAGEVVQLEVTYESGLPASNVSLVIALGEKVLATGLTDSEGRAALAAPEHPSVLYVNGATLSSHPLPAGPGVRRITLPDTAAISGRVTLRGEPPGNAVVPLALNFVPTPVMDTPGIPPVVIEKLGTTVRLGGCVRAPRETRRVSGDGTFTVAGFRAGDVIDIPAPRGYQLADGSAQLEVTAPQSGLQVDLVPLPALRGRAVWADTVQPVPGCQVRYILDFDLSALPLLAELKKKARPSHTSNLTKADGEGRFEIPLPQPLRSGSLWLTDPASTGTARFVIEDAGDVDREDGRDLGDIALRRSRTVTFRIRDARGAPLPEAFATATWGEEVVSPRVDADGRAALRGLPAEPVDLTFWASHCDAVTVTARGPGDEHLDVTLERCASLEISVRLTSGTEMPWVKFAVAAAQQPFTGSEDFGPESRRTTMDQSGNMGRTYRRDDSTDPPTFSGTVEYDIPPSGTLSISCLEPTVPLTVSLVDGKGAVLWGEQVITLARGEQRAIEIFIEGARRK